MTLSFRVACGESELSYFNEFHLMRWSILSSWLTVILITSHIQSGESAHSCHWLPFTRVDLKIEPNWFLLSFSNISHSYLLFHGLIFVCKLVNKLDKENHLQSMEFIETTDCWSYSVVLLLLTQLSLLDRGMYNPLPLRTTGGISKNEYTSKKLVLIFNNYWLIAWFLNIFLIKSLSALLFEFGVWIY